MLEVSILLTFGVSLLLFLRYSHGRNPLWNATVTPLASIIGSGFLVVAPLLHAIGGGLAPLYMLVVLIVAFSIGSAIRLNIRYEDKIPESGALSILERASNLILSLAYVISVAFYLRLLSSFLLSTFGFDHNIVENLITSAVLVWIGIAGYRGGLTNLEWLEKYSVSVKLAVILSLLTALFLYDAGSELSYPSLRPFSMEVLRELAGMLLIAQGFETSKYLKGAYEAGIRIRSMINAQVISGAIYIVFVILILPLLEAVEHGVSETEIIDVSRYISFLLPYLLVIGAIMSQFSAAVADTVGSGGLLSLETRGLISARLGYLLTAGLGIVLVWSSNIFEIISYASRAFALYYLFQTLVALGISIKFHRRKLPLLLILIPVLCFVVLMAEPLEGK